MREGDEIISTLGLYKMTFHSNDCSFNFQRFNKNSQVYENITNKYQGLLQNGCLWVEIQGSQIVTDTGNIFVELTVNTSRSYLIIDDLGTLRFIGISQSSGSNRAGSDFQ